ncbi:unnamed protein product [Bursaphelenchus xylophilus]|uniref:(pine wood nematode) hypothetical protein n=1 Tax=Bursaphelenchus xylophilus TaxID=6326 RepID=A0A1I7SR72_BURXY|nr:unnamed protein product [Bursaphelenchus xylophilus]CAG9110924.1 unnamed protein product [Bursaphelenchus xylophilus]
MKIIILFFLIISLIYAADIQPMRIALNARCNMFECKRRCDNRCKSVDILCAQKACRRRVCRFHCEEGVDVNMPLLARV